jgi:TonB-linked SusC/RagA family outer membrane protein
MNSIYKYLKRRLKLSMLMVGMLMSFTAYAQQIAVTGTVSDESGETVPGASIVVKGTDIRSISNIDGKYSIGVPNAAAVLQISFLGYEPQEFVVGQRRVIDVVLKETSTGLEEVVVVGYGSQRVKDLTGSAVAVNVDQLIQLPGSSIIDALAGQVVGLHVSSSDGRPGSVGSLRVREELTFGTTSNNFKHPLIVIDDVVQLDDQGEPNMQAFNNLDYSEIESLTILKDASAAIYGTRASAGVILVKTKRGQDGKTKIDYSTKIDFSDAVGHIKVMDAYETGLFTNRMIRQQYDNGNGGTDNRYRMYSGEELMAMKSLNHDWLGEAWHSSVSQRHSLTVTGGHNDVTFFAGLNYQNQGNNLGSVQDYDKWTFRAGGEMKVAAGLKLSASVAGYNDSKTEVYRQSRVEAGPWGSSTTADDYPQLRHMPKYIPISVDLRDPLTQELNNYYMSPWTGPMGVNTSSDANLGKGIAAWNFFANEASKARSYTDKNGYNANFSLTYDVPFVKGLTLKAIYAVSYDNTGTNELGDYYQIARADNTNQPGMHLIGDYSTWTILNFGDPNGAEISRKPVVDYGKSVRKSQQMNGWITYNRSFGKHDIAMTGVVERGETEGSATKLRYGGITLSYLGTSGTAGTLDTDGTRTSFTKTEAGSLSYAGRVNYKFDNRYLLEFLIRSDASTKFAPENYWGTFPSGSAGWVLSEEKFFKSSKIANVIDFLKFRYSLGKTGKDNATAWMWLQTYSTNPAGGIGFGSIGGQPSLSASPSGTANRNITWDTSVKQNLGLDINVLRSRLAFTAEYWKDQTTGLIMKVTDEEEPIYIGQQVPETNYGAKDAWGWEFSVRWTDRIQQSLIPSWGPIRYGIGFDYGLSWTETVKGQPFVFDYPADMYGGSSSNNRTGWQGPGHEWGFRTWKHTSSGDGMLRTEADIDKYWQYLTDLATAAGTSPQYFNITNRSDMKVGMLAYEDVAGDIDQATKKIAGPNGVISRDHGQDYVKLANKLRHSIPMRLNFSWGNFTWQANLGASWGGWALIDQDRSQSIGANDMIWAQFAYVNDMFDPVENPNGKFPSMGVSNAYGEYSDFWMVSTFRMNIRNMQVGYSLPKQWLQRTKIGIDRLQINLIGNNLWDFYNPYPYHYRNMYDAGRTGYPTLRTWSLGINATF